MAFLDSVGEGLEYPEIHPESLGLVWVGKGLGGCRGGRYCGLVLPCCRRGCVVRAAAMASTVSSRPSATLMMRS
jgi:hypothetical protein